MKFGTVVYERQGIAAPECSCGLRDRGKENSYRRPRPEYGIDREACAKILAIAGLLEKCESIALVNGLVYMARKFCE
jgi:hypothetical protein